jgi:diguanylate cyclase (GGDEF)-like protein
VLIVGWTAGIGWAVVASLGTTFIRMAVPLWAGHQGLGGSFLWDVFTEFAVLTTVAVMAALLRRERRRVTTATHTDALTGLLNGPGFHERLAGEINRSNRSDIPLTVAFLDCDKFKAINDTLGHVKGDEVLRTIASTLRTSTRNYDVLARMGGDEFAVLLPETGPSSARTVVGRLQANLAAAMSLGAWPIRFSIGAATFPAPSGTPEELIRAADEAMYAAKRTGKGAAHFITINQPPAIEVQPPTEPADCTPSDCIEIG